MPIQIATTADIPALVALLDGAYRGNHSRKGWTTEADLLEGDRRTDEANIAELMQTPGAVFLKSINASNELEGCVFLQQKNDKTYLGMLSVSPLIQARGLGKQLMKAAVDHASKTGSTAIFMRVISVRKELIEWYERQGYEDTGNREPFPDDQRFGKPTRSLEFMIMEKKLGE